MMFCLTNAYFPFCISILTNALDFLHAEENQCAAVNFGCWLQDERERERQRESERGERHERLSVGGRQTASIH